MSNPISNKKWRAINNPKRIDSNGKQYFINWLNRKGKCEKCSATKGINCKHTIFHHEKGFFMIFPWFGIIELCSICDNKEKWRLGEIKNAGRKRRIHS